MPLESTVVVTIVWQPLPLFIKEVSHVIRSGERPDMVLRCRILTSGRPLVSILHIYIHIHNNRSFVYSNKHFRAFFVPVYGFVKDRKLRDRFEKKTGVKMIACIYYDLLRHVNSNLNPSSPMKLNTTYRSQGFRMMIEFG